MRLMLVHETSWGSLYRRSTAWVTSHRSVTCILAFLLVELETKVLVAESETVSNQHFCFLLVELETKVLVADCFRLSKNTSNQNARGHGVKFVVCWITALSDQSTEWVAISTTCAADADYYNRRWRGEKVIMDAPRLGGDLLPPLYSLVPRSFGGEMTWQLPRVQTVCGYITDYSCTHTSHEYWITHVII